LLHEKSYNRGERRSEGRRGMKKIGAPLVVKQITLSSKFRQNPVVLQLRGPRLFSRVAVRSLPQLPDAPPRGVFCMGPHRIPCAIGRSGISLKRREGDGFTPIGRFLIVSWMRSNSWQPFRADCKIAMRKDGWCDDPGSFLYNRKVVLPFRASAERLERDDGVYDLIGILDFNFRPRIIGRGSAIFLHLAHPDLRPTAGCIALKRSAMRKAQFLWSARLQVDVGDFSRPLRFPNIAEPTRT
jgi:L,D-peptidoglycan transpeptidase YkuD (ErfK/YbiS/YcfS/YnhG family)